MLCVLHSANRCLRKVPLWWRVALILSSCVNDLAGLDSLLVFGYPGSQGGEDASGIPVHPKNSTNSAEHVDHDVAKARRSARNERLVQFVTQRIDENKRQGQSGVAQFQLFTGFIAQRSQE